MNDFLSYGNVTGGTERKVSPVTEIINEYNKAVKEEFGIMLNNPIVKSRVLISRLLKEFKDAKEYVLYCVYNWNRLSVRFKIESFPTIAVIYGFRHSLYKVYVEEYK